MCVQINIIYVNILGFIYLYITRNYLKMMGLLMKFKNICSLCVLIFKWTTESFEGKGFKNKLKTKN